MTLRIVISLLLTLCTLFSHAGIDPNYGLDITLIDNRDGLASNETFDVAYSPQGFMWIGTANGLCRYDGYEFSTYKSNYTTSSFFISNTIRCIRPDTHHNLWMITSAGLEVMDIATGKVDKYGLEPFGPAMKLYDICVARNGTVWFAADCGLWCYDAKKHEFRTMLLLESDIRTLYEDSHGILWLGTFTGGICTYDPVSEHKRIFPALQERITKPTCFWEDSSENMWIGTWREGLFGIDPVAGSIRAHFLRDHTENSIILCMVRDAVCGYLWVGTYNGVKIFTDTVTGEHVTCNMDSHPETIVSNEVRSLVARPDGNVWIATLGGGVNKAVLYRHDFSVLQVATLNHDVTYNDIHAIHRTPDGIFWLGVKMNLWLLYNPLRGTLVRHSSFPPLRNEGAGQTVCNVTPLDDGRLWVNTRYNGAFVVTYTEEKIVSKHRINYGEYLQLKTNHLLQTIQDRAGNIWVATQSGIELFRYAPSGDGFVHVVSPQIDMLTRDVAFTLLIDRNGKLWIGTEKSGILSVVYDPSDPAHGHSVTHYSVGNGGVTGNDVQCLFEDSRGTLWAGSQGGSLSRFDPQRECFVLIDEAGDLPSDAIFAICEDLSGNLWIGTDKGLVRYSPQQDEERLLIFNSKYDVGNASFSRGSAFRDASGRIYMGANTGLISFDPTALVREYAAPHPVITDILVDNKSITSEGITPSMLKKLTLRYRQRHVTIRFAALAFSASQGERYAYRMEGMDAEWNYTGSGGRSVTYNLRRGNYVFFVRAASENGVWSQEPLTLRIEALPAPWESWWAWTFYTLAAAGLVWFYVRDFQKRTNLRHALSIEQIERRKSEEINHAKLVFFTNISHELFTPLTILSCSVDELSERLPEGKRTYKMMRANINRLLRLLMQILEFRKAESGNLVLKVSRGDITAFIDNICRENFTALTTNRNISLDFHASSEHIEAWFDPDKVDKIIYNLLSNAFKYNYEGGRIRVSLLPEDDRVCIEVADTGSGIPEERLGTLFTRFYEGDYRKFNTHGTGIGLSLVKDLVDLHGGTISVESRVGEGTTFRVCLPATVESYTPAQIETYDPFNEPPTAEESVDDIEEGYTPSNCEHILIIDDNRDMLQMLENYFTGRFEVTISSSGEQALELVRHRRFDLILTDYAMPGMSGVELCQAIKGNIDTSHIPVVMLTAKRELTDKVESFEAGADMYITKPFELPEVQASIISLLGNRRRIAESFRRRTEPETSNYAFTPLDQSFLKKATDIVSSNLDNTRFTAENFARTLNISQATLYRKLTSLTGLSSNEFIRNVRIKRACEMLLEYNKNISEVAYAVGYNNPKYFSNSFKKETGMTPREWILSHQKKT